MVGMVLNGGEMKARYRCTIPSQSEGTGGGLRHSVHSPKAHHRALRHNEME